MLPARLPAYVIERIAPPGATARQGSFYRITAIGFGSRTSTQVVLQSLYRLPLPNGNANGHEGGNGDGNAHGDDHRPQGRQLPAGRIGWGEIANWAELHARARP
jgi:type IV pilus assembly protein PilX